MHGQPIADPAVDDDSRDSVLLDLLVVEHDGIWSVDELKQLVGDPVAVDDVLARLGGLGLVHRVGDCAFATRAAAHMHRLAS